MPIKVFKNLKVCHNEQNDNRWESGRRRCIYSGNPPCGISDPNKCELVPKKMRGKSLA